MSAPATYGDISQRTAVYAMQRMLMHAEPILVIQKFADHKPIPRNKSQTVAFRRAIPYAVSTTPAQEGVTPSGKKTRFEDVQVSLSQYLDYAELTDVVQDQNEDPVLEVMSRLAGEQAAETVEMVSWGAAKAGTSVIYTNGSARTDVNTVIDDADVRSAVRYLMGQRAKRKTTMLAPSVNIGTRAIEPAFIALGHTDMENDIRSLTGFVSVADYGSRKPLCAEELGSVPNVRFVLSPLFTPFEDAGGAHGSAVLSTSGTLSDVYPLVILGQESFCVCPLRGADAIVPMVLNPNVARGGDPAGQRGSVAWKTYFTAKITNDTWMVRLEVAASVLKSVATA